VFVEMSNMDRSLAYKILTGIVVPRPIAFVSTLSPTGIQNCAPFSFFNVVSTDPPMVGITVARRGKEKKDTIVNAEHTGDFVVNVTVGSIAEKMNLAATDFPGDVSEFEEVGLTAIPSRLVKAPRIAESPVNMECVLDSVLPFGGDHISDFLIGRVVAIHYADGLVDDKYRMDFSALNPVGRLAGMSYCHVREFYDLKRLGLEEYQAQKGR